MVSEKRKPKTESQYAYDQKYIKESYKWINIQFNKNNPDEMALYEWVKSQSESQAQYIKRLIANDMGLDK